MYPFHYHFQHGVPFVNWTMLEAIGTIAATTISAVTLFFLKMQLEKEQEPYVVARDDVAHERSTYKIKLKNVGRGPAFNITGCRTSDEKKRNDGFFMKNQPHSKNLCSSNADAEGEKQWRIDDFVMGQLEETKVGEETYKYFYFFYESQLGSVYYTRVKIKKDGNDFIVMDNMRNRVS